jgi:Glycosyl transferases group 1
MAPVTVDVAGGPMGGAARFRDEFVRYLARSGRDDVRIIGMGRRARPSWLVRRELGGLSGGRRVALNNVGFLTPGGERWTLLGNALHFLADGEMAQLDASIRARARRQAAIVRLAARRSDVLVAPCTAMAERVRRALPAVASRVVVRFHPISAASVPRMTPEPVILCPVFFRPYKHMGARLAEMLAVLDKYGDSSVRLLLTATHDEVPADVAGHPSVRLVGHLQLDDLSRVWGCSKAIYFPSGLESFGYPLAEARVSGRPVIARGTPQNQEIAGPALCGYTVGDADSLGQAVNLAMTTDLAPDPSPFDPDAYFTWMLGDPG